MRRASSTCSILGLLPLVMSGLSLAETVKPVSFNRDIRPILSDTCYHCHGFDEASRKGGLRLDIRDDALKSGKSGLLAVVPGKPEESEIIQRIFADDEADLMPPKEAHKTLTAAQKELFRRWVAEGANYEEHWAYTSIGKPQAPRLVDEAGVRNDIDRFIRAGLEEKKIEPSSEAAKHDLIRRLSLDLTGLPPSPEETQAFVSDQSADAYDKLVNRLLRSPHYGERMAVWWLDVARFTDTVGYHGDQNQRIFPYRDYVIQAFNSNKSFKDFTIEQLAGDLLPNPTKEQLVATGFNRLNMMTREGGAQPKEYLSKYGAERTRTVGTAWLGATFGCAECHDHKFDPISQRDFYALQAFFADVKQWGVYSDYGYSPNPELKGFNNEHPFPPEIEVASPYLQKRLQKVQQESQQVTADSLEQLKSSADAQNRFRQWRTSLLEFFKQHPDGWESPLPSVQSSSVAQKGKASKDLEPISVVQDDGRVLFVSGKADDTTITLHPSSQWVSAIKVELLPLKSYDGSILRNGSHETVKMTLSATVQDAAEAKPRPLAIRHMEADRKRPDYSNGAEVVGIVRGWKTSDKEWNKPHTAIALLDKPLTVHPGSKVMVKIDGNLAGQVKVSLSPVGNHDLFNPQMRPELHKTLARAESYDDLHVAEAFLLSTAWRPEDYEKITALYQKGLQLNEGKAWSLITESVPNPLTVRVLPRGNWMDESGAVTPPATPEFLPVSFKQPTGEEAQDKQRLSRLDLANWLCAEENPLTARAVTNRLWKEFFGQGLSSVVDDLGAQGEPPSHPELLDWLAAEFRNSGWDIQHVIRLMVSSATYRQSSNLRPDLRDVDPNNRLLASQNPRRLEAEFVRDNALSIAGLLNVEDIGGPSVKPYQPGGYYENLQFPSRDYMADTDDQQWRRGVYMHWQRTFLHPMLANFDAPSREECTAFRPQSNTPQQALTLLNDPTFVEAARVFAERMLKSGVTGDGQRLDAAFQRAVSRPASDAEKAGLLTFLNAQRDHYKAAPEEAAKLVGKGLKTTDPELDRAELAAWTSLCRVVLNLHETITRY